MINLLPKDYRLRLRYGRLNTRLRRWVIIGLVLIGGMLAILAVGLLYIDKQIDNLNKYIATTETELNSKSLINVQKQAEQISQNIHIINQVLGREIRFSDLIQEIGKVMPNGTVLGTLTLSKVNGAVDVTANAKSYSSAAQVAVNLSDPKNNIFDKVDIISINCSADKKTYPCTAIFRAQFEKNAESRFLNLASEGSQ